MNNVGEDSILPERFSSSAEDGVNTFVQQDKETVSMKWTRAKRPTFQNDFSSFENCSIRCSYIIHRYQKFRIYVLTSTYADRREDKRGDCDLPGCNARTDIWREISIARNAHGVISMPACPPPWFLTTRSGWRERELEPLLGNATLYGDEGDDHRERQHVQQQCSLWPAAASI